MEPIAIIGVGCRFPGARNHEEFWHLLHQGVDAISEVPFSRWDIDAYYDSEPVTPGKMNTRYGGFIKEVDLFDPSFFGISPREAERMDPQQRLFLEVAWETLENAAVAPSKLSGSQTGVFVGIGNYDYGLLSAKNLNSVNAYDGTGNSIGITAARLSYLLNLRGPSLTIETACSSSLVALHLACQSLRAKESDSCLVGAVSLMLSPTQTITYSQARMMAPDGRCKTFDASADGYVRGEGCGVVLLKRLQDAIKDGDRIQAIIKGSAINQDGLTNGLTAPNGPSQQAVIRQALQNAGVEPSEISYVEAHGTGTSLGDPIEVRSLKTVLMQERQLNQPCWIGSVKTNIGHLEAAAGIAGLIKVVLSLQNKKIPPHLHLKQLNKYISFKGTPFEIPTKLQPWQVEHRIAGISSFGFGGTNAHVILEEAPILSQEEEQLKRPLHLLTLSAKSQPALQALTKRYQSFLTSHPELSAADICFSTNTGREHFDHRLAIVVQDKQQLQQDLINFAGGDKSFSLVNSRKTAKIAFLFTGQGSQYIDMAREIYDTQATFRQTINLCDEILRPYLKQSLLSVLYPSSGENQLLHQTAYTQPALFALEYALCRLWQSWGIEPTVVMGHSVGEYVAACIAGVFSLEDGLKLIAERGRLMQSLPSDGGMVAVMATEEQVAEIIASHNTEVAIAAVNGPQSVVISGKYQAITAVVDSLSEYGIKTKRLQVSHAFHSPLMQPMLQEFERIATGVEYSQPRIKMISNVTGNLIGDEVCSTQYWCRHILESVRFAEGMKTLAVQKCQVLLEIGSKPILLGMGRQCLSSEQADNLVWLPSLRQGQRDWQCILDSMTQLYQCNASIDWSGFDSDYLRNKVSLPSYPFQRQRYWIDSVEKQSNADIVSKNTNKTDIFWLLEQGNIQQLTEQISAKTKLLPQESQLLTKLLSTLVTQHQEQANIATIRDSLYEIQWQLKPRQSDVYSTSSTKGCWLILTEGEGITQTLVEQLQQHGNSCITVYPGDFYQSPTNGADKWVVNPHKPEDFHRLLDETAQITQLPIVRIVHLWGTTITCENLTLEQLEQSQVLGCASVLHLVQAIAKFHQTITPKLWLVTRGAIDLAGDVPEVAQASLWGMAKTIALEYPELFEGVVDLSKQTTIAEVKQLYTELEDNQGEDNLVLRDGKRYVARLMQSKLPESSQNLVISSEGCYLIAGGLGVLGLKVAQWLVNQGAGEIVLIGRKQPSQEAFRVIEKLKQSGAKVFTLEADITQQQDVEELLVKIGTTMSPLKGIIQAAGVVDYQTIEQLDEDNLLKVLQPKVTGTWLLHKLTEDIKLDFFVMFSSIASVWGSKGQAHYAAANAFLDGFARYRQGLGMAALTINWGPWAGGGMATAKAEDVLIRMGVSMLPYEQGIFTLEYLLQVRVSQATVACVDWKVFQPIYEIQKQRMLLEHLRVQVEERQTVDSIEVKPEYSAILQELEELPQKERSEKLIAYLQTQVAQVLKLEPNHLPEPQRGFFEMGMDSLMAMDLKNRLEKNLAVSLPPTIAFECPTIVDLASFLEKEALKWNYQEELENKEQNLSKGKDYLSKIQQLSQDAIEENIAQELADLETLLQMD
ncbi:MAG: type I polyketide synthase [Cyanobacteria bacterium J06643_5]